MDCVLEKKKSDFYQLHASSPGPKSRLTRNWRQTDLDSYANMANPSWSITSSGFPPYLENLKNWEFCHLLFQAWKMPGICSKSGENPKCYLKTRKKLLICKFDVSIFTFSRCHLQKKFNLHLCHILHCLHKHCDSRSNWPENSLLLPGTHYRAEQWKINHMIRVKQIYIFSPTL